MKLEALVYERTCGNRKLGEEVYLVVDGVPFARVEADGDAFRTLAGEIAETMSYDPAETDRPPKVIRMDRSFRYQRQCANDRDSIEQTILNNLRECHDKAELMRLCARDAKNGTQGSRERAKMLANELFGCRQFVLGVIEGRGHALPTSARELLKQEWEAKWDTAFADSVIEIINS